MNFEFDVFVSYAHLDDAALVEGQKGWVANLHRALEIRVGQFHGKAPHIWRDPKLQGNDDFAETLLDLLKRAAVLVSVVSPRYVRSEWTTRELSEFCRAAAQQVGVPPTRKARIFKVLKTPVPLDQQTPELRCLLGYEFFSVDPQSGKIREFNEVFGPDAQRSFWITLDDLAHDLCEMLDLVEGPEALASPTQRSEQGTVFLAETTVDLKEQREVIKRDLQQHGYRVLPTGPLSLIGGEVDTAVSEDLARCSMSIHLIGNHYSLTPEGAMASLVEIQSELAIKRGERGGFSRLVWIPPGLQVEDPRQRKVIDQLRMDPRMGPGADLLESPLEDLLTVIQDTLSRARAQRPTPPARPDASTAALPDLAQVYLLYDARDAAAVSPYADFLFAQGVEVIHPVFEGDEAEMREYHEENLRTSDGVVMFLGVANEAWLRHKFRELQKIPGYGRTKPAPVVAVLLLPPKTPEKERFRTHEALVVPQWDGMSLDACKPIIARLKE
jgi:hypothetical protein